MDDGFERAILFVKAFEEANSIEEKCKVYEKYRNFRSPEPELSPECMKIIDKYFNSHDARKEDRTFSKKEKHVRDHSHERIILFGIGIFIGYALTR